MKQYIAPVAYLSSLPAETQSYLLTLVARNVERQLNLNVGRSYSAKDINASFIAELLCIAETDAEGDEDE